MPFTIMSFNVRGSIFDDGANAWPHRADLNVATIRKTDPDLIGFQEAQRDNMDVYAETLPEYDHEPGLPATMRGDGEQRNPIYWKRDRFEAIESGGFYLSDTPEEWSQGWGAYIVRAANWVRLRDRETDQVLLYLNTHLDHEMHLARLNGSALIVDRVDALREREGHVAPAIVSADFNDPALCFPGNQHCAPPPRVHSIFTGRGYRDTFWEAGHVDAPRVNTVHFFRGVDFSHYGVRIDWILTLDGAVGLQALAAEVVTDADPPVYPSDHYPVTATLEYA